MIERKFVVRSLPQLLRMDLDVAIFSEAGGERSVADPLVFRPINEGSGIGQPTIGVGGREFLQACLDHAWEIGLRPTGEPPADPKGELAALRDHLHDMRALVFKGKVGPAP